MNDMEYMRHEPARTRDIYLELVRIEERGMRLSKGRRILPALRGLFRRLTARFAAAESRPSP